MNLPNLASYTRAPWLSAAGAVEGDDVNSTVSIHVFLLPIPRLNGRHIRYVRAIAVTIDWHGLTAARLAPQRVVGYRPTYRFLPAG